MSFSESLIYENKFKASLFELYVTPNIQQSYHCTGEKQS